MNIKKLALSLQFLLLPLVIAADSLTFSSTDEQTTLIELYSSEGCSSCPPADQFLSQFKNSNELWTKYIPLAFHVDYWDYIGWKDVFAQEQYSNRQRKHKLQQNISSVYTPGFVINGLEWTGFFKPWRVLPDFNSKPGILTVTIDNHRVKIEFPNTQKQLKYNLAIIGTGLITEVKSGENDGRKLSHDFVVLDHQSATRESSAYFDLPLMVGHQPNQYALVAWISDTHSLKPIQATGGYLPEGIIRVL